jgi:hypothetical protein
MPVALDVCMLPFFRLVYVGKELHVMNLFAGDS